MKIIHQAKTKFKTEWEGSYPAKRILSDPFSFLCLPYTWFKFFFKPLINLVVSPYISRFFDLDLQVFGLLVLRRLQDCSQSSIFL